MSRLLKSLLTKNLNMHPSVPDALIITAFVSLELRYDRYLDRLWPKYLHNRYTKRFFLASEAVY